MVTINRRGAAAAGKTAARGAGFGFQYQRRTPEEVKEYVSRPVGGREQVWKQGATVYQSREGTNTLRILPPPPGSTWRHYGYAVTIHRDIGVDQSAFVCLHDMKGEPCPVCEERLNASADPELSKALRKQKIVGIYVIDRSKEQDGPQLWVLSASRDQSILKLGIDPVDNSVLAVDDPENGYDFSFTREGQGLKTKYKAEMFARRESPLSDDPKLGAAWLKHIVENPINELLVWHDYDHIKAALEGQPAAAAGEGGDAPAAAAKDEPAKPKFQRRGTVAAVPAKEPEPPPPAAADAGGDDLPSYADLEQMDENGLSAMVEEFQLDPGTIEFTSEEQLRDWIAETMGIEKPKPEPAAAAAGGGNWRDRLNQFKK